MPTLLDIAIGLPILIIKEDARLRHERIRLYLEVFAAFRNRALRNGRVLVEDPDKLGYELMQEEQVETDEDPFAASPLGREQIYPEGVWAHAN